MAVADSPVMKQYAALKAANPGALLMFRMGDFYELFGEDAITAASVLQITLTRRRTAQEADEGVPMCGVPYHAAEGYIGKLLQAGYRVALTEQMESPEEAKLAAKSRGGSTLVRREVVRLFTPGTLTEEAYLEAKRPAWLVAVVPEEEGATRLSLAWLDLSTGDVGVRGVGLAQLPHTLAALPVGELILPSSLQAQIETLGAVVPRKLMQVQPHLFAPSTAEGAVRRAYKGTEPAGLGLTEDGRLIAVGALLGYAELTQLGKLPALRVPSIQLAQTHLQLDAATRRSLDLLESQSGHRSDTLLGVLDDTVTSAGGRLVARWVSEPLAQREPIMARQDAVAKLVSDAPLRRALRKALEPTGDVARAMSRLLLNRGSPRDLGLLRTTGSMLPTLQNTLTPCDGLLATLREKLDGLEPLTSLLHKALAPDPLPALIRNGGFVAEGFDAELDTLRALQTNAQTLLAALEQTENAQSGLQAKVRYNQVWGYYLEVSKNAGTPPAHWVHRQTTTSTHRYTTPDLAKLERDLGSAAAQAQAREEAVLDDLIAAINNHSGPLLDISESLATLDALASLAEVAARNAWAAPTLTDDSTLQLNDAKHPVVASKVSDFVPNSANLKGGDVWLITGPNMAGKSTFLRQTALLVVMAQLGSFVPATTATIGLTDALFCRVGAADNLAAGQSTFMVEMLETANILNRASARSLVILDELGRGTATYDGLALAWACVEDLTQRIRCRTLFATHYHELTALAETLPGVSNHQLGVKVWKDSLVFLHQVTEGAAAGSYGVQVAKLAGVPSPVVARAQSLLAGFEAAAKGSKTKETAVARLDSLSLFTQPVSSVAPAPSEAEAMLRATDADSLSAREALDLVYKLKALLASSAPKEAAGASQPTQAMLN